MKGPPNLPTIGDKVRLRGRKATGTIKSINKLNWVQVTWDKKDPGITLVHLYELEKTAVND